MTNDGATHSIFTPVAADMSSNAIKMTIIVVMILIHAEYRWHRDLHYILPSSIFFLNT